MPLFPWKKPAARPVSPVVPETPEETPAPAAVETPAPVETPARPISMAQQQREASPGRKLFGSRPPVDEKLSGQKNMVSRVRSRIEAARVQKIEDELFEAMSSGVEDSETLEKILAKL